MKWFRDRALTLILMGMFRLLAVAQLVTGRSDGDNVRQRERGEAPVTMTGYLATRASVGGTLRELGE